jgi:hypothetical protein
MSLSQDDLNSKRKELVHDYLENEGLSKSDIEVICKSQDLMYRANLASLYRWEGFENIAAIISENPEATSITKNSIRIFQMICYENYQLFKEIKFPDQQSRASYCL